MDASIQERCISKLWKAPFEVSQLYTKYSNANRLLPDKIFFDETKENQDVSIFSDRIAELSKNWYCMQEWQHCKYIFG